MYFVSSHISISTRKALLVFTLLIFCNAGFRFNSVTGASSPTSGGQAILESTNPDDSWNPPSSLAESDYSVFFSETDEPEDIEMMESVQSSDEGPHFLYDPVVPVEVREKLGGILLVTVVLDPPLEEGSKLPEKSSVDVRVVDPRLAVCSESARDANLLAESGTIHLTPDAAAKGSRVLVSLPLSTKTASFMRDSMALFSVSATVRLGWALGDDGYKGCCKSGDFITTTATAQSAADAQAPYYFGVPIFSAQVTAKKYIAHGA